ncbi:MAG: M23 family metallopeptidase [Clostridiaceae bacterium]
MNSLESDNENKDEIIKNYQDNEDEIKTRLSELDKLEDAVKSKIENSISLNNIDVNNLSYSKQTLSSSSKDLIISLDTKIDEYTDLSKELDNLLEKEKYIPSFVPCQGEISSYFGDRENPFDLSSTEYHKGLDIANYYGTKIYASAKGTVTLATYYGGYGNAIIINHHNGYETIYGHTSKIYVSEGDEVEKGDLIALVGSTGSSTGPHLHFELRKNGVPINPLNFIQGGF